MAALGAWDEYCQWSQENNFTDLTFGEKENSEQGPTAGTKHKLGIFIWMCRCSFPVTLASPCWTGSQLKAWFDQNSFQWEGFIFLYAYIYPLCVMLCLNSLPILHDSHVTVCDQSVLHRKGMWQNAEHPHTWFNKLCPKSVSALCKPVYMVMLNPKAKQNSSNDSLFSDLSNSFFDDIWTLTSNICIFIFWYSRGFFIELKLCLHFFVLLASREF